MKHQKHKELIRISMKEEGIFVFMFGICVPWNPTLGERTLKYLQLFSPSPHCNDRFASRSRAHHKPSKKGFTFQVFLGTLSQETKCSHKEKTPAFAGWQQQVPTRLRTGQDTSTEIPEGIILNVLWSCHLCSRWAFPSYCTLPRDSPTPQLKNHQVKKKVTLPSQRGL